MNAHTSDPVSAYCPRFHHTVELIGRRWSGAIVRALLAGSVRFSDILQRVPGLSDRLLSERLRELEAEGIVERCVFPEVPVRVEYRLTPAGRELVTVVEAIDAWAARWASDPAPVASPPLPATSLRGDQPNSRHETGDFPALNRQKRLQ